MVKEVEIPNVGKVVVDRVIDCRDQVCPRPQIVARKALEEMRTGQVGEVLITNPPSLDTVPRVIGKDSTLLGTVKNGDMWRIYFRKGE
jgi:TusA-related sulfurtransferase